MCESITQESGGLRDGIRRTRKLDQARTRIVYYIMLYGFRYNRIAIRIRRVLCKTSLTSRVYIVQRTKRGK